MTETNPPRDSYIRLFRDFHRVHSLGLNPTDAITLNHIRLSLECYNEMASSSLLTVSVHVSSNSDRAWDAYPKPSVDVYYRRPGKQRTVVNSATLRTTETLVSGLLTVLQTDVCTQTKGN